MAQDSAADTRQQQLNLIKQADLTHHLHPFTDDNALKQHGPLVVTAAKGTRLFVETGIQLLDMVAGLGCVNIGYGREDMAERAAQVVGELSFYHTFQGATNPYTAVLAKKLSEMTPGHLNKSFFTNSGSEANETIVKLARAYWRLKGKPEKIQVVAREYAYHGSTLMTASLNGLPAMHQAYGLPLDGVHHIPSTAWYRNGGDQSPEDFALTCARALEAKVERIGADRIGLLFVEPVQVGAGVVFSSPAYWAELQRIAKAHDILIAVDETVTGFGRMGEWVYHPKLGIEADFVCLAKGMSSGYQPVGAAMVADHVAEVLAEGGVTQHGFTTSGHPVVAGLCLKNIEILAQEYLLDTVRESLGPRFQDRLQSLADHPLVGEVRGEGLAAGIELVADKATRRQYPLDQGVCGQISNAALMQGVVVRPVGNALVLCPPLVVNDAEIEHTVSVLESALDEVHGRLTGGD
ncbi:putrescine aminotransferase [Rhodothalassium salexigens DSM 2132]|uniref:Putrescine aminotransferase n=1 Tax=Rhodothalassium salexigens DSM 2132 TaxID=1188247 RepID=A0A4V2SPA0_RHOSA|nr:aminotransferase [Rhodothalassium salexigens]MBB4211622.1 putrescine aminotransferase [Rhodothalassium salexigens DSM 2132]MBK1639086.1 hypothetical protein [Rhodothalassium salexigens DSM 2132]TCP34446.1 putrescine aminotransferase [Rhodothalassium salexigens DSM 2132]